MWWQILEILFSGRANVGEEWLKGAKAWGCFRCVRPRYLLSPLTKPTHKGKISISRFSSNRLFHEKVFLCNMRRLPVWCQSPTRLFLVLSEQQGVTQPGGNIKFKIKIHSVFFFLQESTKPESVEWNCTNYALNTLASAVAGGWSSIHFSECFWEFSHPGFPR